MFQTQNIPIYLDNITPEIGKDKEGDERRELNLSLRIHPFPPQLAAELDSAVRNVLWSINKVEVSDKVSSVGFDLKLPAQAIMLKAAPDASRVQVEIPYARIAGIVAKKHKGIAGWALTFHAKFPMPGEHELALLHNGYKRQHFLSFEDAAPDLISEMEKDPDEGKKSAPARSRRTGGTEANSDVH